MEPPGAELHGVRGTEFRVKKEGKCAGPGVGGREWKEVGSRVKKVGSLRNGGSYRG